MRRRTDSLVGGRRRRSARALAVRWKALVAIGLFALSTGLAGAAQQPATGSFADRTLEDALLELRSRGLKIIYTSNVVRPAMTVAAEPTAEQPRRILDELLEPHGLEALDGPNETIVVVPRLAAPEEARATSAGSILGSVRSRRDATPVASVTVRLVEAKLMTTSNGDGSFVIAEVEAGSYTLEVRRRGFVVEQLAGVLV